MSFTSHVVPIGEGGNSPTLQTEIDPIYIHGAADVPASSIGSEGSNDDPVALFPDRFVDMAKESSEALAISDQTPRKKKSFSQNDEEEDEEETPRGEGEFYEEIL